VGAGSLHDVPSVARDVVRIRVRRYRAEGVRTQTARLLSAPSGQHGLGFCSLDLLGVSAMIDIEQRVVPLVGGDAYGVSDHDHPVAASQPTRAGHAAGAPETSGTAR
jgi:hypothetical protein